jgi:hypothetical protein
MDIRAAEVEGPVSVMTIGALEVRVGRRMRLHITSIALMLRRGHHVQKRDGCTIAGSVYQAPQRRFAVHGTLLDWQEGCNEMWVVPYVSTETKGRRRALG